MPTVNKTCKQQLEKCRHAALAAVEAYNKPGPRFRTAHYIVLITIAWTACFHAIFYNQGRRPWFRKRNSSTGRGVRYQKIDGEPRHWDLKQCLKEHFGDSNPPERQNLDFLIGLRNKIEHRHLPELDAAVYGECQSALLNLEEILVKQFGARYALEEQLAVSLQFSKIAPTEKRRAIKAQQTADMQSAVEYIERYRGGLPTDSLNSMRYSFNVYLVPQVVNRQSAADAAVQFVNLSDATEDDLARLTQLNVLIRDRHLPIVNLDMHKPGKVAEAVQANIPWRFSISAHTEAWKHYQIRPLPGAPNPERTQSQYCVYDRVNRDYLYRTAWIERLSQDLQNENRYVEVVGRPAIAK